MKESQSQFIKKYCEEKNIKEIDLNKRGTCAIFCDCEDGGGKGHWAMIPKEILRDQIELFIHN